jgi:hypothetical protein
VSYLHSICGRTIFDVYTTDERTELKGYFSYPIPDTGVPENYDYDQAIPRTKEEFEAQ